MSKQHAALVAVVCALLQAWAGAAQPSQTQPAALLALINDYRVRNGAPPLQLSATLTRSAQWMSADMAANNYFSHTDSRGRNPFARMASFGYRLYPEAENIAAGHADAQSTFTQWRNACDPDSTGACTWAHRQNMLNASYRAIGIGRSYRAGTAYGWYWTTDFGATR